MAPNPIGICPGPCDTRTFYDNADIDGPRMPAAIWRRGENVTIRYQRNNHGPGGFVRLSIVPIDQMLSKRVHERNAFHYSCWGGGFVAAKPEDIGRDKFGFSLTGSDGREPSSRIGYYTTNATIPLVIPDGRYALGWAWYGGIGGSLGWNKPEKPFPNGLFSDYWSCSFIQIRGGERIQRSYRPVFQSNLEEFWGDSCWSAQDAPGGCKYEPCRKPRGSFQRPRPFKNGATPSPLKPWMFRSACRRGNGGGTSCDPLEVPFPPSGEEVAKEIFNDLNKYRPL